MFALLKERAFGGGLWSRRSGCRPIAPSIATYCTQERKEEIGRDTQFVLVDLLDHTLLDNNSFGAVNDEESDML